MTDIFTILKNVSVNHQPVAGTEIVVTDVQGKPNGLLTDLVHDLINDALLFVNLAEIATADDLIDRLHAHTPGVREDFSRALLRPKFCATEGPD
ncbi:hypothetical protein [Levilactobacillus namurensis]|uniref:hypothetical protein n=1 Tax=Levilactobacillus namurensis TaxID=380393 RepID=UPI0004AFDFC9